MKAIYEMPDHYSFIIATYFLCFNNFYWESCQTMKKDNKIRNLFSYYKEL